MTTSSLIHVMAGANDKLVRDRRAVSLWLGLVAIVLFTLVLVGGLTRMTDSGLSITEWKPIHGIVPPLNEAEWVVEFNKYKQIPEYSQVNNDMVLEDFKRIFWWEWAHRALARGVGLIFALPLAFFWMSGRLEKDIKARLLALLALGGLQGAVGWWMVTSGLTKRVDVSQYRLALHLSLASLIFAAIIYVMRGLAPHSEAPAGVQTKRVAGILALLLLAQIYLGGLVAGLDAGLSYNTWPLMDGSLIPADLFILDPAWRNLFENPKTAQFVHRGGAYLILVVAVGHMIQTLVAQLGSTHARRSVALVVLVVLQSAIGITALLTQARLHIALAHQAMALVLLAFAVAHWRATKGSYPVAPVGELQR
jgi:heme a synthase